MLTLENKKPYWFTQEQIETAEKMYNAKYMGYWSIKDRHNQWTTTPVEVFYQPNPDISKGHSNYFGLYIKYSSYENNFAPTTVYICNAQSAFEEPIAAFIENDIIYASRYRNDFTFTPSGKILDGARDYTRINLETKKDLVYITVDKDSFVIIKEKFNVIKAIKRFISK